MFKRLMGIEKAEEVKQLLKIIDEKNDQIKYINSELIRVTKDEEETVRQIQLDVALEKQELKADHALDLKNLKHEKSILIREIHMGIQEAKNELKKKMAKKLTESDVRRAVAEAKLEVYEKMDTKSQVKDISAMLNKAIGSLGENKVNVNVNKD